MSEAVHTAGESIIRSEQIAHTQRVIENAKDERDIRLDEETRKLLLKLGFGPDKNGKFDREIWRFFKRTIDNRTRPDHRWKMAYAADPQSERVVRLLNNNIPKKTGEEIIPSSDCISVVKKIDAGHRLVEVHYGSGETENDLKFISDILNDPNKFLTNREIPIFGTKIKIIFRNPTNLPVSEKINALLKRDRETNHRRTRVEFAELAIPMTFEQLKQLDLDSGSVEVRNNVGRHHKERYLEIREPTVRKVVEQIILDLEANSPNSNLLKFIKIDKDFVVDYIYKKAVEEKDGDLSLAMGNLFEAVVQIELRDGINNDLLSETIWKKANARRVRIDQSSVSARKENSGKTIMGGDLGLDTDKVLELKTLYQNYCRKYGLANSDLIVIEEVKYIDSVTNEIREKNVPSVLVELKTNDLESLSVTEKSQLSKQVKALPQFIEWYNEQGLGKKISAPNNRELVVVIIRPSSENATSDKLEVVDDSAVHVVRSSITKMDLIIATNSKDKITHPERSEELAAAIVNDLEV